MKDQQIDACLEYYLPAKPKPTNNDRKRLEKKLQKVKDILIRFQKDAELDQQKIQNQRVRILKNQACMLQVCEAKLEKCIGHIGNDQLENQLSSKLQNFEDIYAQQLQLSQSVEQYILKLSQETLKLRQAQVRNLQGNGMKGSEKSQLPQEEGLHSSMVEELEKCQQEFNKLLVETQEKLQQQISDLEVGEKVIMEQLDVAIASQIRFLQASGDKEW